MVKAPRKRSVEEYSYRTLLNRNSNRFVSLKFLTPNYFAAHGGKVDYNGVIHDALWWPLPLFQNLFKLYGQPKTDEDIKAFIWMMAGPKPSLMEKVEMKLDDTGKMVVFIITMKELSNGVEQKQECDKQGQIGIGPNDTKQPEISPAV